MNDLSRPEVVEEPTESHATQLMVAMGALMFGVSIDQYREEVKARAKAYREMNELAAKIRDERREG